MLHCFYQPYFILGPFKATNLWNDIIDQLRRNVTTKRRKVKGHAYDCCFHGADATDVVLQALHDEHSHHQFKEVSREKAVKVGGMTISYFTCWIFNFFHMKV